MINAEQVAMSLKNPRRTGSGWMACCPAHEDDDPSLSITDGDGKVLVHCHAGCSQDEVLAALVTGGIHLNGDARLDGPLNFHAEHGQASALWDYYDKTGTHVGRVMRFDNGSGKTFRQASLHGGSWIWKAMPSPRPLYRLREAMRRPADTVLVCEGEKAADAAQRFLPGAVVVSWPGGSKAVAKADWTPLADRKVILWPDADAPGYEAMDKLAGILRAQHCDVELVDLTALGELPTGWDAADATPEQQEQVRAILIAGGPEPPHRLRAEFPADLASIANPPQSVRGLIEDGSLVLIYGESNTGKSTLTIDLGMAVSRGADWRGRKTRRGLVLHIAGEGLHGVRGRVKAYLLAHDLDPEGIPYGIIPGGLNLASTVDVDTLLAALPELEARAGCRLAMLILDTLARCAAIDENDGRDMGRLIAACDRIRKATGATVALVHHAGKDASKGARGHSSLRAAVDTELLIEGKCNPRRLSVTKQRDLPPAEPVAFNLEPVTIGQDHETHESITAVVVKHDATLPPRRPSGKRQAELLAALEAYRNKGEVTWTDKDLRRIGREMGMSKESARSAVLGLTQAGYLTPSVGGLALTTEATP